MSVYGLRITDPATSSKLLVTPEVYSIISTGRVSMPTDLEDDDTYGLDIDLPGTGVYEDSDIGVLVSPFILNIDVLLYSLDSSGSYGLSWYMHDTFTYYTRNASTGVMTVWTPDVTPATDYDAILSIYPAVIWDKMGATTFTSVRLFAAMCYEIFDQSTTSFKTVYSIGTQGVEQIDYTVYARRYSEA
jgi:hypothetical protein